VIDVIENNQKIEEYHRQVLTLVNLPTLPIIATEIIRATREDRVSVNQILPILEKDPPLAMKVLKMANSAYYGIRERVTSLRHAVVIIGLEQLTGLALSFSVIKSVNNDQEQRKLYWRSFWEHSSATGTIAQMIAEDMGINTPSNTYAAGLLHDIGKLVLYKLNSTKYGQAFDLCRESHISSVEAETKVFDLTHELAGSWISEKWKLPENIHNGISYHHQPDSIQEPEHQVLPALIQIADWIANHYSFKFGNFVTVLNPLDLKGWQLLKNHYDWLKDDNLNQYLNNVGDRMESIREMIKMLY